MSVHSHISKLLKADYGLTKLEAAAVIATCKALDPSQARRFSAEYDQAAHVLMVGEARGVATKWKGVFR